MFLHERLKISDAGHATVGLFGFRNKNRLVAIASLSLDPDRKKGRIVHCGQKVTTLKKNEAGALEEFRLIGEHYWRQRITEEKPLNVTLPVHQKEIIFEVTRMANRNEYEGPWRFLDVARLIAKVLMDDGESLDAALPHRLIKDVGCM